MEKGIHTIRSGITEEDNPAAPRKYSLDNGDYQTNMKIMSVELMYAENDDSGAGNSDRFNASTVFFTIATSAAGATPFASTDSPEEYGAQFAHRFSDSRQICWGTMTASGGTTINVILDSDNIIPGDLYVNAWSTTSGGSLTQVANSIGFVIKMKQVKSSGDKALLYRVRETELE
jgi:hypothetical protein